MPDKKEELTKEQKSWINFMERARFYSETLARSDKRLSEDAAVRMKEAISSYRELHQQRFSAETLVKPKGKGSGKKSEKKEGK